MFIVISISMVFLATSILKLIIIQLQLVSQSLQKQKRKYKCKLWKLILVGIRDWTRRNKDILMILKCTSCALLLSPPPPPHFQNFVYTSAIYGCDTVAITTSWRRYIYKSMHVMQHQLVLHCNMYKGTLS